MIRKLIGSALAVASLGGLMAAPLAYAHHSYAMFDHSKQLTLAGTVRIWEFTNPHAYLWVYVKNDKGAYDLYGLEAPGPTQLVRAGWNKNTVKPGDRITVLFNPLADGRTGGNLLRVTLPDGRSWQSTGEPRPPPPGTPPTAAPASN